MLPRRCTLPPYWCWPFLQVGPFNHGLPSQAVYTAFDLAGKGGVYRPWPGAHIYIAKLVRRGGGGGLSSREEASMNSHRKNMNRKEHAREYGRDTMPLTPPGSLRRRSRAWLRCRCR